MTSLRIQLANFDEYLRVLSDAKERSDVACDDTQTSQYKYYYSSRNAAMIRARTQTTGEQTTVISVYPCENLSSKPTTKLEGERATPCEIVRVLNCPHIHFLMTRTTLQIGNVRVRVVVHEIGYFASLSVKNDDHQEELNGLLGALGLTDHAPLTMTYRQMLAVL